MVDLSSLASQINAIDSALQSTGYSVKSVQEALGELSKLKYTTSNPEDLKALERKIQGLKDLQRQARDTYETERKGLELVVGQNKQLLELLDKTILKHEGLRKAVLTTAGAYQTLKDKGDLGQAISQMSVFLGKFQALGVVIGTVISAATNFQDRVQLVNKTIIDTTASLGRFSDGMVATERQTLALSTGMARYAAFTGMATDELYKHVQGLGQLGFSLDEMGIDRTTGEISTLTDSIRGQTGEWGALATAVGVARATGLDINSVMQQMGMQIKTLGGEVEDVAESFAALSLAADKSGLSTQILLPLVRGMQEQFKFLGFDTAAGAEMLGKAGDIAKVAGVSVGQATEAMAKAIGGIARMDFGQMAFFGQQMGIGGGLAAGFRFREQAGGAGGANMATEIGRTIGNLMGGGGNLVTEEQAKANEHLAGIRLAQEQFAAQTLGLSQNEARVFINIAGELEKLRTTGEGQSDRAKELEKQLQSMEMGEKEYRRRTLTMQQKIAQLLELISAMVGRIVLTFMRAFMGSAAEGATGGVTGLFKTAMDSISKGEGFDVTFGKEGLAGKVNEAFKDVDPVVEKWGRRLGKVFDGVFGSWWTAIPAIVGGAIGVSALKRGITGLLSKGLAAAGLRTITGVGAEAAGGAVARIGIGGRLGGALRGLSAAATKASLPLGTLAVGIAAAAAAGFATKIAMDHLTESVNRRVKGEEDAAAASNKHLKQLNDRGKALENITGKSSFEAKQIMDKVLSGQRLTKQEDKLVKTRGKFLAEQAKAEIMRQKELAVGAQGGEGKGGAAGGGRYIKALYDNKLALEKFIEMQREKEQKVLNAAAGERIQPHKDALSISKQGWLYASPGDMVVAGESMGSAMGGSKGEAARKMGGEEGGAEPIVRDVVLNVKFMNDLIGEIAQQQVMISIEKDLVAPGKAGKAGLRHGQNKGYG